MMKKIMRIVLPILLLALICGSLGWYLFVYDRGFTRDMLLQQARYNDLHGNSRISSWFYDMAYNFSGRDANVAIELSNQYKESGNYTKAESTLSHALKQGGTVELYTALSKVYAEQDKLMDAVELLDRIPEGALKDQIEALRPQVPTPDQTPGFYSQYISVSLESDGTIYFRTDGEYPTTADAPFAEPITLATGETVIEAVSISQDGLVSRKADLAYTVGGVIEPVVISDAAMDREVRKILEKDADDTLYTNDLWKIEEFTVPQDIKHFDDLIKIPYLRKLTIHGFQIDDLDFLAGFDRLKILDLSSCRLTPEGLEPLATLPALEELVLGETGLSSISGLENVKGLTKLDLRSNTIRNVSVLKGMPNLKELNMSHNALTDLSDLGELKELSRLDISHNAVTSLEPLAGCIKLTQLDASNNQITSPSGLESLSLLTYLALDYNQLTDISLLSGSTQLETLKVSNNQLTDLSCLEGMSKLDGLYFAQNQVTTMPQWAEGGALRIIDGSNNQLETIDCLTKMEQLAYVYLDYNLLTSVDAISGCYKLVQVNVYGNEIGDVSALTEQDIIVNYDPT